MWLVEIMSRLISFISRLIAIDGSNSDTNGQPYCGKTKARTGDLLDYIPVNQMLDWDIGLHDVLPHKQERVNIDKVINSYGRQLIKHCKCTGLQICNGRTFRSSFTCYKYISERVVDYVIASYSSSSKMNDAHVNDKTADMTIARYRFKRLLSLIYFYWDRLRGSECENKIFSAW